MASAISPVATKPTAVSSPAPADWNAAVKNTYDHGVEADMSPFPLTRGLADVQGATDQTHHADYMNLWGAKDTKGQFVTGSVSLVSEDWKLESDNKFHIDQWLFQANPDGTGIRATHGYLVEDTGSRVYDTGSYKVTDDEASVKAGQLIGKWAKFQPKASFAKVSGDESSAHVAKSLTANGFALTAPTAKGVKLR